MFTNICYNQISNYEKTMHIYVLSYYYICIVCILTELVFSFKSFQSDCGGVVESPICTRIIKYVVTEPRNCEIKFIVIKKTQLPEQKFNTYT